MTEAPRLSERVVFGEATTRRLRVDHRPDPVFGSGDDRRCFRCSIPLRFVRLAPRRIDKAPRGYWQHVPRGRVVVP